MLKSYPAFRKGEIEEFYNKLSKTEKDIISDYLVYRKARGCGSEEKLKDIRRYLLHLRFLLQKEFKEMNLKDLRNALAIINTSRLCDYVKNTIKTDLKNFLKYLFSDWSLRFANLEDIKLISKPKRKREINHQTIFQKDDIEKMMRHEAKAFWKAFLITQYECALRTIETRILKWDDIKFNVDGDISEISIFSTKTKENRTVFVKEATFYLKKLREEQENLKKKGIYVFHAINDTNQPIGKDNVSKWFRTLTQKALGRQGWNYLLRHSRGTELYRLAKQGKIAKDTAIEFMGHGEDMSKTYTNLDANEIKEMLKSQIYKLEDLPEEKKHELEKEINEIKKEGVAQQDEITKLRSKVNNLEGMWDEMREVKMILEAIDKSEIIKAEIKKYRESLPSRN